MRKLSVVFAILLTLQWSPARADHTLAVAPFEDDSGFDGAWDIGPGLAELLSARLGAVPGYRAAGLDSAARTSADGYCAATDSVAPAEALFDSLQAGYLVTGTIEEFGISRFGIVSPTLGGYQSYRAGVRVSFHLWERGAAGSLLSDRAESEVKQGGLGLTLLGRPTDEMQQWEMLDALEFGSESFMATIIGGAVDTLLTGMVGTIRAALPPQKILDAAVGPAVIVSADGDQLYINRGFEDDIHIGDRFEIYRRGEQLRDPETGELLGYSDRRVGLIRISFVKSAHLSVAVAVEGEEDIEVGDEVR
jgi:hypothetical protein